MSRFACLLPCLAAALASCAGPRTAPAPAAVPPPAGAEVIADPGLLQAWEFLLARHDRDGDGTIAPGEHGRGAEAFAHLDTDGDGRLTAADFADPLPDAAALARRDAVGARLVALLALGENRVVLRRDALPAALARLDADGDGRLDAAELHAVLAGPGAPPLPPMTATLLDGADPAALLVRVADRNGDGALDAQELDEWFARGEPAGAAEWTAEDLRRPCMAAIMGTLARPRVRTAPAPQRERVRPPLVAEVGQPAPDFRLVTREGDRHVTLSDFRGRCPVALVFGSYTCPPFRNSAAHLGEVFARRRALAEFLFVYIREAHALDGDWPITGPGMPLVEEPLSLDERRAVAQQCARELLLDGMTVLVDELDDRVNLAYAAAPERLYLIDRDGSVVYQGRPGPSGFDVDEFEAALAALADGPPTAP